MKHSHNHIPLLILAATVTLTVAILYVYMFYATSASVYRANLARDIVNVETVDQTQAKSLSALASSTASVRATLPSLFVPADNVVVFITAMEAIGPQSGSTVSLASIDADSLSGKPVGTVGAVRAHIDAVGSWSSVMRALALAERMPYAVSMNHVSMNAGADSKSGQKWSISFDIQAAMIAGSSVN